MNERLRSLMVGHGALVFLVGMAAGFKYTVKDNNAAPPEMYGLRRPHRSLQVLSLNAPIRGWMNRPVMGPAMLRIGRSCSLAPMYKNNGLTAENTMPNPNELPKNPSVITRMFIWVSGGFRSPATASSTADGGLT